MAKQANTHPLILLSRAIPEEWAELTDELIDKLHLVLSATKIHHSTSRQECFEILVKALPELEFATLENRGSKLFIKQGIKSKEIILHYVS